MTGTYFPSRYRHSTSSLISMSVSPTATVPMETTVERQGDQKVGQLRGRPPAARTSTSPRPHRSCGGAKLTG
jgi:hypothetical protein